MPRASVPGVTLVSTTSGGVKVVLASLSAGSSSVNGAEGCASIMTGFGAPASSGRSVNDTRWPSLGEAQVTSDALVRVQLLSVTLAPLTANRTAPPRTPVSTLLTV